MSRRWRRALGHPSFGVGVALTSAIVATALCSLVYTPRDPLRMELTARLEGPSAGQPMGTDQYGRDLLSRVMRGSVASLAVGAVAVGIGMAAFGALYHLALVVIGAALMVIQSQRADLQQLEANLAEPGTDHDRIVPGSETAEIRGKPARVHAGELRADAVTHRPRHELTNQFHLGA